MQCDADSVIGADDRQSECRYYGGNLVGKYGDHTFGSYRTSDWLAVCSPVGQFDFCHGLSDDGWVAFAATLGIVACLNTVGAVRCEDQMTKVENAPASVVLGLY